MEWLRGNHNVQVSMMAPPRAHPGLRAGPGPAPHTRRLPPNKQSTRHTAYFSVTTEFQIHVPNGIQSCNSEYHFNKAKKLPRATHSAKLHWANNTKVAVVMVTRNLEKLLVFYFKHSSGKWRAAYIMKLLSNICPQDNYTPLCIVIIQFSQSLVIKITLA